MNRFETNLIGDRLRFLRKSKGLSQGAAATLLETPISSYKKYELNKSTIPHTILEKIVKEMNTTFSFLIYGKDDAMQLEDKLINIRSNTFMETKIENGFLIATTKIPLAHFLGK